jgi:hypothetical protein
LVLLLGVYFLTQTYFKLNGFNIEGYGFAIISLFCFIIQLPFLVFFLIKKKTSGSIFTAIIVFQFCFLLGVFLSQTLIWMIVIVILSAYTLLANDN